MRKKNIDKRKIILDKKWIILNLNGDGNFSSGDGTSDVILEFIGWFFRIHYCYLTDLKWIICRNPWKLLSRNISSRLSVQYSTKPRSQFTKIPQPNSFCVLFKSLNVGTHELTSTPPNRKYNNKISVHILCTDTPFF